MTSNEQLNLATVAPSNSAMSRRISITSFAGECIQKKFCAPGGIRTPNLLIRSQMLYPLSHGRIVLCTLLNITAFNSVMQIRVIQSPEIRLTSGFAEHQMRDTRPPRGIVDPNSRTFIRGTTSPTMHKARRPL